MNNIIQTIRHTARAAAVLLIALLAAQTAGAENVTVTSSMTNWTSGNTYNVTGNVTINDPVTVTGTVTLNIASGCTLNVNNGITVSDGGMLTVTASGGWLNVRGSDGISIYSDDGDPTDGSAGIAGNLTVESGTVTITGGEGGDYRNKDYVTAANGGDGVSGNLTVNGGTVTVTGGTGGYGYDAGDGGYGVGYLLTVNDGNVTVYGGASGSGYQGGSGGRGVYLVTVNGGIVLIRGGLDTYYKENTGEDWYRSATNRNISYADNIVAEEKAGYGEDYHLLTGNSSSAEFLRFHPDFFQDGDTWSIYKSYGWNAFCDALQNNAKGYFSGKTVVLGDDITVSRMAGVSQHDFTGTFDGQGHTLTINYANTDNNVMTAPFSYVDGATIRNLIVDGSITGSAYRAAGVIGETGTNKSYITNCVSSLTISSGRYTAGFSIGGNVEIEGCVFNGKINGTDRSGGFIGFSNSAQVIKNSLFAPKDGSSISGGTFYYNGGGDVAPVNSYYTRALGTAQGKQARSITVGDTYTTLSNISLSGSTTEYTVSGITAYANGGIKHGSALYYGNGDQVSLTLSHSNHASGGIFQGYAANNEAISGNGNPYSLTMPDADVTIMTIWSGSPAFLTRGDGNGTSANPYKITNADDMRDLAVYVNGRGIYSNSITETAAHDCSGKYFKQTANITLSGAWTPIGEISHQFKGIYDGDNNKVSGLRISGSYDYAGLFGYTYSNNKCILKNIIVENCNIDISGVANSNAGGIVGYASDNTDIQNCRVSGTVKAASCAGGIAGKMWTVTNGHVSRIIQCFTDVTVAAAQKGKLLGNSTANGIDNSVFNNKYSHYHNDGSGVTAIGNVADITYSVPVYTISGVTSGVTIDTEPTVTYGGKGYYTAGANVTISYTGGAPEGYQYGFTVSAGTLSGSTLTMPAADVTVSVNTDVLTAIPWSGDGSEGKPYIIKYASQLDLLAHRVNGTNGETANGYSGTYFQLANDITYPHKADDEAGADTESNYEAIGGYYDGYLRTFCGHFDGNSKTISGIRIYKGGESDADCYQGIFGQTVGADIHDVVLADARITGYINTGSIVGYNNGTVTRCHVAADVAVCAVQSGTWNHGGIAGCNSLGTIEQCTSAVTLTIDAIDANSQFYGGIAGENLRGTLHDNLAIGATVPAAADNTYGAITGNNYTGSTLQRNYYAACKVADTKNATGVGCGHISDGNGGYTTADVNNDNYPDGAVCINTLDLTANQAPDGNYWTTYYNSALGFTIDDDENACAYTATYGAGKLTLHKLGKQIPAGTAVIIVAENNVVSMTATALPAYSGDDNDLHGVDDDTPTSTLGTGTFYVLGMTIVDDEQHFGFHRYTGEEMAAHKAFVLVDSQQALTPSLMMVFDDASGIESLTPDAAPKAQAAQHWFTLDGRRLQAKPTAPGIYINNGRKVVIK